MAIPTVFKKNRMRYDAALDTWILTTDFPLPDHAVKSAGRWTRKLQIERSRSMPAGDKRELVLQSIRALDARKIKQQLVNATTKTGRGDLTLFEAKR